MNELNCIFCQIIRGEQKSFVVLENEHVIAFLDKRPLFPGHCLLLPKEHIVTFYDLPTKKINSFFAYAQDLGKAVEKATQAEGSFIAMNNIVSQSVPHLHLHIVPRNKKDGLKGFFWPRFSYPTENDMENIKNAIKKTLAEKK